MRAGLGFGLLLAAVFAVNAHAATMSSVSVTGNQISDNSNFSANFTVTATNGVLDPTGSFYTFMDNNATVNGVTDPLTINVGLSFDGDTLQLLDGNGLNEFLDLAANPSLFFDPSVPAFNPGSYTGFDFCLTASAPVQGLPSTLAMFQAPTSCLTNVAATVATVTPEPSSIALFGTGFLGVAGIVRRRFYA